VVTFFSAAKNDEKIVIWAKDAHIWEIHRKIMKS
jgi:hypothetical protein